jgi:hypothetical protein
MPIFAVAVRAELEGIKEVTPQEGRSWMCKFQCTKCREVSANFVEIDPNEEVEIGGGTSNASFKCKECKNAISATVVRGSEGSFGEKGGCVVKIDVRGGEPVELLFDDRWSATGNGDAETKFEKVDLSEDYADYDEAASEAVTISGATATFARQ